MLGDALQYKTAQLGLSRYLQTVQNVVQDDPRRDIRGQAVVNIIVAPLVFHEIGRTPHLADIVIQRHDPANQAVGANGIGAGFSQIGHHGGMVIGAWRLQRQFLQQWIIGRSQFQQAGIGGFVEQPLERRQQTQGTHPDQQARHHRPQHQGQMFAAQTLTRQGYRHRHHDRLGQGHRQADAQQFDPAPAVSGGDARDQHTNDIVRHQPKIAAHPIGQKQSQCDPHQQRCPGIHQQRDQYRGQGQGHEISGGGGIKTHAIGKAKAGMEHSDANGGRGGDDGQGQISGLSPNAERNAGTAEKDRAQHQEST